MYYVNHNQINSRLEFIPVLLESCRELQSAWTSGAAKENELIYAFAQERTLHLAIEAVTDVGSLLIDAFMMRDASSYEDIIDVLHGEGVFDEETANTLKQLVQLRKPLVQEYTSVSRAELHPLLQALPDALAVFARRVPEFISKEMV